MAISRSQMRRQLSNRGGITNLSPRQNFGLGSSLKKFVRKIIPNEVSKVATAAAPFVAPFNPALAAGMAGIGSFDQSGSLSDALKRGALTYGGGQAARFIGGAGFQQNPFTQGGAFRGGLEGFKGGFTTPFGTDTGLGKFFEQRRVANIGKDIKEIGEVQGLTGSDVGGNITMTESAGGNIVDEFARNVVPTSNVVPTETTFTESIKKFVNPNISVNEKAGEALDLLKKGGKAVFTKKNAQGEDVLDKTVLLGTLGFALSYAEAKSLADDIGVDITEAEYDEATKADKQEQYAANLENFFAGKKDGGRIGFQNGSLDVEALMENIKEYPEKVDEITDFEVGIFEPSEPTDMGSFPMDNEKRDLIISMLEMGTDVDIIKQKTNASDEEMGEAIDVFKYGGAGVPIPSFDSSGEMTDDGLYKGQLRSFEAEGGRQGFLAGMLVKEGIKQLGKIIFSPAEKTFLFKNLGKLGGADRSQTFPNLFKILKDPSKFPKDAKALKAFIELRMKKARGGIMDIPVRTNKAGVQELDMRSKGGFVPIGVKEKADDVPAMLSKNEFVLTADAVRGIGGGSVEKGSEKLYNVMKQAEQVGRA